MPRVAKPKAAKGKVPKRETTAEDLDLSPPVVAESAVETEERMARAERPSASASVVPTETPKNGENDSDMVLRPPTKPVETTESDTDHERRERRVTGAETA